MPRIVIPAAALLIMLSNSLYALGLGDIEMNSALNQPLDAEIQLTAVKPGETDDMIVTLASQEAFQRAGIDRPFSLSQLQFSIAKKPDGLSVIKVQTDKPIVEPFLNFLIEVDWPNGRLIREYTVLLDPPVFMTQNQQAVPAGGAETAAVNTPAPVESVPVSEESESAITTTPERGSIPPPEQSQAVESSVASASGRVPSQQEPKLTEYGPIGRNETLWVIANSIRPDDIHVNQMMIALLRFNPDSFIQDNINLLKRGAVLRVPDRTEIDAVSVDEAFAAVKQQNTLWREYVASIRAAKAQVVEQGTTPDPQAVPQTEAESVEAEPQSQAEQATVEQVSEEQTGSLKLVGENETAEPSSSTDASATTRETLDSPEVVQELTRELELAAEELETQKLENKELTSRISELEETVTKMERLITLRENQLAELQERIASEGGDNSVSASDTLTEPSETTADGDQQAASSGDSSGTSQSALEGKQSFIERLSSQPGILGAIGAILLLLLGWFFLRRRKNKEADVSPTPTAAPLSEEPLADGLSDSPFESAEEAISPAGDLTETVIASEDEDKAEATVVDEGVYKAPQEEFLDRTVAIPSEDKEEDEAETALEPTIHLGDAQADETLKDDTIAEADVYLAYGLYGQAEDLLKLAIEDNPGKEEYHLKLLETYYADKSAPEFADAAQTLHDLLQGKESDSWNKVAAMGKDLCPENPLFKEGDVALLSGNDYVQGDGTEMPDGATMIISQEDGYERLGQVQQEKLDETVLIDGGEKANTPVEEALDEIANATVSVNTEQETVEPNLDEDFDLDATSTQGLEFDIDELAENPELLDSDEHGGTLTDASELEFDIDEQDMSNTSIELSSTDLDLSGIESDVDQNLGTVNELSADIEDEEMDITSIDDEASVVASSSEQDNPTEAGTYILDDTLIDDESVLNDATGGFDIGGADEVDTMLDLAKAYIDMGDTESANSALKEVAESGNEQQKVEAKKLLEQMS